MIDTSAVKQHFKDASDEEAKALYVWVTACMEVRGLIQIDGAAPSRKRRSDAGTERKVLPKPPLGPLIKVCTLALGHEGECNGRTMPGCSQPSLSGLPDETGVGE